MTTAIVIGAGMGGLTAAASLAAQGCAVTVLERAASPGGKLRQVQAGSSWIDAGPTVLTMRWVFEALFAEWGETFNERVRLSRLSLLARHAWSENERLDLFADPARTEEAIAAFAGPREAKGYARFRRDAARLFAILRGPFLERSKPSLPELLWRIGLHRIGDQLAINPYQTLWGALGGYFRDPRLRQLFARYATYAGSSPFRCPATLMLIAHVEQEGVWSVEGGMHALARGLAAAGANCGVRFEYGAEAARIELAFGRVAGVRLQDGRRLAADVVVFNGDPGALAGGLLGPDARRAVAPLPRSRRSLSAWALALEAESGGFPLTRHNVFFSPDYRAEFADVFRQGRPPVAPSVYICAQDRGDDPTAAPIRERLLLLVNAPACGDAGWSAKESEQCERGARLTLARCGLTLPAPLRAANLTTPEDFARLFPGSGGGDLRGGEPRLASLLPPAGGAHERAGPVPGGRGIASGRRGADGGAVGAAGGGGGLALAPAGPDFSIVPPDGGYVWWYVDAISADGRFGLTIIGFVGSVFSPYYAAAGRRDPREHVAINAALYGPKGRRWAMTERGGASLRQARDSFTVGPSRMIWGAEGLTIHIDEVCAPIPRPLRGAVRLRPQVLNGESVPLDPAGRHVWRPIAPHAEVEVEFENPRVAWRGAGYFDTNQGAESLEAGFSYWHWSRAHMGAETAILYEVERRDGSSEAHALWFDSRGRLDRRAVPKPVRLPNTVWGLRRDTRADGPDAAKVLATWEDGPFYARSKLSARLFGQEALAVHEALDLNRFRARWVHKLLPVRMPRQA